MTDKPAANPEAHPEENAKRDAEVAAMSRTIQPKSDAPSRAGIKGSGSGADTGQGEAGLGDGIDG